MDAFKNTESIIFKELVMTGNLDCQQYAKPKKLEDRYSIEVTTEEAINCYSRMCEDKLNCNHRKYK